MKFPGNHRFAFTILDDTDDSTLENVRPVYDRLSALGLRTTKTVWPMACPEGSRLYFAADTLERPEYLAWTRMLAEQGFEIASHGATMESSDRPRTEAGFEVMAREYGAVPRLHANHGQNRESLYWGGARFQSPMLGALMQWVGRVRGQHFEGQLEASPHFWGDLSRQHLDYVRNFTFAELDMLKVNPDMPYALASTRFVPGWFSTTDAPDGPSFKRVVTRAGIDRLARDGGVCIVSTHLGKRFVAAGELDPEIDSLLSYVVEQGAWCVPVTEMLDHLKEQHGGVHLLAPGALMRLELRFLASRAVAPAG